MSKDEDFLELYAWHRLGKSGSLTSQRSSRKFGAQGR